MQCVLLLVMVILHRSLTDKQGLQPITGPSAIQNRDEPAKRKDQQAADRSGFPHEPESEKDPSVAEFKSGPPADQEIKSVTQRNLKVAESQKDFSHDSEKTQNQETAGFLSGLLDNQEMKPIKENSTEEVEQSGLPKESAKDQENAEFLGGLPDDQGTEKDVKEAEHGLSDESAKDQENAELLSGLADDQETERNFGEAEQSGLLDESAKDQENAEFRSGLPDDPGAKPAMDLEGAAQSDESMKDQETAEQSGFPERSAKDQETAEQSGFPDESAKDQDAAEHRENPEVTQKRKEHLSAETWNNQMLNGILSVCMKSAAISVRDSLRNINHCIQSKYIHTEGEGNTEDIPLVPTTTESSTTITPPLSPEHQNITRSITTTTTGPTGSNEQDIEEPHFPHLKKPIMWIGHPIRIWSWDELDIHASNLPIVSTCITLLEAQSNSHDGLHTTYVQCHLHVYNNDIAFQEVAGCLVTVWDWTIGRLNAAFPADYRFDDENCLEYLRVPDPMYVCVYTRGNLLKYPSIFVCVVYNTAAMHFELEECGVTDFIFHTGVLISVHANDSCEDQEAAQNMELFVFEWCTRKVQYCMMFLCLILGVLGCVAMSQINVARNIRGYVFLILPLSTFWLFWTSLKLLVGESKLDQYVSGFLVFSKVVDVFPVTINTYLMTAVTVEKFIAVSFPFIFRRKLHIIKKICPMAVLVASLLSILDVIRNIYFHTVQPRSSAEPKGLSFGLFAILSIILRGVLPALVCSVVNVMKTVKLFKRFTVQTDLPEINPGCLKRNLICSSVASVLLISCIVEPIEEVYVYYMFILGHLAIDTTTKSVVYVAGIAEFLFIVSNGANLVYLCLLCPDLYRFFTNMITGATQNGAKKHITNGIENTAQKQNICVQGRMIQGK